MNTLLIVGILALLVMKYIRGNTGNGHNNITMGLKGGENRVNTLLIVAILALNFLINIRGNLNSLLIISILALLVMKYLRGTLGMGTTTLPRG